MKGLILLLFITISNSSLAQSFRIAESPIVGEVDVFVMPGINSSGDKLMQFSFIKFKKLKRTISTNQISLITVEGNDIILDNPIKDTCYLGDGHTKSWFVSFVLDEDEIEILKKSNIAFIEFEVGNKKRRLPFNSNASKEMANVIASKF